MKLILGLLVLVAIVYTSSLNWRKSVKAMLVVLIFEGALRKWVLPQASELIYFLKEFILLGAYLNYYGFSGSWRFVTKNTFINALIFLSTGWCLFQAFNPSLGSPLIGLFGLKAYLFYIPLIWMLPALFSSQAELHRFLHNYLLWTIPVGLLGAVQFVSPADSFINTYAPGGVEDVATFGVTRAVRVTGTFPYIAGYTTYLLTSFGFLIPLLTSDQTRLWRWLTIAELILVIANSFMTGSRGVVFTMGLFLVGYLGIRILTQPTSAIRLVRQFTVPVIGVFIATLIWFQPAVNAFWLRVTANQDISNRVVGSFTQPFDFLQYKELDGYGTGATHQGAPAIRNILNLPPGEIIPVYYESEMGRVVLELGPLGFVFWYGLRLVIVLELLRLCLTLKQPLLNQLALSAFLIQMIQINSSLVFNYTASVYYWFMTGFILLLPQLEQVERQQQSQIQFTHDSTLYLPGAPRQ